jgi:hypothetical protein
MVGEQFDESVALAFRETNVSARIFDHLCVRAV